MRTRVVVALVAVGLLGSAALYAAVASGGGRAASCSAIRVSGGNFNGLVGGTIVAGLGVRNEGATDCTVNTRPWIRLGPIRHAVAIQDAAPGMFGRFGAPERSLTLRPGQRVFAQIFIAPGSCDQARSATFELRARAGWARRSVPVSNLVCKDGTGTIYVGSFQR